MEVIIGVCIVLLLVWGLFRLFKKKGNAVKPGKKVRFDFLIYDKGEKIEPNKWYQKASWKNKNFVSYNGTWNSDWKWSDDGKVKVAGISRENRTENFLYLAQGKDFRMFLEDEPENPINKHARKVMISATFDGEVRMKHVGYLPDEIATKYAGVELDISPASAFLPTDNELNLGVEVALLVRSARYLKKQENK
jgi:hypothetical protein